MMRYFLTLLICCPLLAAAAYTPAENSKLNHRIVGFMIPDKSTCTLEIAAGNYTNIDSFKKNVIISGSITGGKKIVEVPEFNAAYTWMVTSKKGPDKIMHHFSTLPCPVADTSKNQFRIITSNGQLNNYYVFVDVTGTLYDMQGNPVWFVPASFQKPFAKSGKRDLKITPSGTISFLNEDEATEIDYNANIIFSSRGTGQVSGDTAEFFHHEFTRLANGHYMMLGSENVAWKIPGFYPDSTTANDPSIVKDKDDTMRQKMEFCTIIEYDEKGKVIWSWRSSGYFRNTDLPRQFRPDGRFRFNDVHGNAFYFDEKKKVVYLGFRDISRIIKIKYPEGTILAEYGANFDDADEVLRNDFFCGQHSIALNNDGDLCVYNNNATAGSADPKIVVLKETPGEKNGLQKVWEFDCTPDGMNESERNTWFRKKEQMAMLKKINPGSAKVTRMTSGGNVVPLAGSTYFVSMGGEFCKSLLVDQRKEILWSAIPEMRIYTGGPWTAIATYRSSIITNKELESLIWHSK